jgi:calcineurin-like phosphoesterase family protein
MASEQLSEELHALYIDELERSLRPPVHKAVNAVQARAMLHQMRDSGPAGLHEEPDEKTWIWSDLHLGHDFSIGAFGRPFRSAHAADKAMHHAWIRSVADDDTIICLGDISVDGCLGPHHVLRWQHAPGSKVLVHGNHDVDPINKVGHLRIHRKAFALVAPGDPPLLLTHIPLLQVPLGTVNVHGHIHEKDSPTSNRHINVSVEQLHYAPASLKDIRRLARRLVEGRKVPGDTTSTRLRIARTAMP